MVVKCGGRCSEGKRDQMSIEQNYSIRFIASLALREKQIQQNYRPIIAVHKWFARRPGTLFRGLLAVGVWQQASRRNLLPPHSFEGVTIADPFMGGGTPLAGSQPDRVQCHRDGYQSDGGLDRAGRDRRD